MHGHAIKQVVQYASYTLVALESVVLLHRVGSTPSEAEVL